MLKLMDKKMIAILRKLFLLNWTYGVRPTCTHTHIVILKPVHSATETGYDTEIIHETSFNFLEA